MSNAIMTISFQSVSEFYEEMDQVELDRKLEEIKKSDVFFHATEFDGYFELDNIDNVLNSFHAKGIKLDSDSFLIRNYGQLLYDMYSGDDDLKLGRFVSITSEQFYSALCDEVLVEDDTIQDIVKAGNFEDKMKEIKLDTIKYLYDMAKDEAEWELQRIDGNVFPS